ncbi:hypothetical protein HMPREF1557_01885 [Streptococcus sobrinus W1703]|uniref:Uncharacterized protein n=1 Tax=Streptococcus sobrinus W1703 TaxID=1227275 RepID=U2KGX9_9STRE|nr:hypothetical protein HMPREF1557_01885 [Streptococcus sobrinus W1703]
MKFLDIQFIICDLYLGRFFIKKSRDRPRKPPNSDAINYFYDST